MQDERVNFLLNELKTNPLEPFNYYGLALEFSKTDILKARFYFDKLLDEFPSYLPTYYTAANFFWALEEIQKAKLIFEKGIALAEPNTKTAIELKSAFQNFIEDVDE